MNPVTGHGERNVPDNAAGRYLPLLILLLLFVTTELRAAITIYVNKHFELRDHDAPMKYIFNANTRVARVTGSLAANDRIQRLRLRDRI